MMLDRMEGNAELKSSVQLMLAARRLTHSVLLVGEEGLGAGFAARCIAADYLYPAGGAPAEALLRGECCRAVGKPGDRDSGHVETGIVREAISVAGMGAGGKYLVSQVKAMRSEIFNTSLSAEGRAVLLYHVERMNEESANALLKVMEEPPEGVLFLLTADSLAGVLPTIRSRCISFAVAPVSPEECARWCIGQGVDKKQARLYSELFDGHIGTVLDAARDEVRRAQVDKALALAKAAAAQDSYAAAVLLSAYEKDKVGAAALLADFRAVAAAGLRGSPRAPVQGDAAGDLHREMLHAQHTPCGLAADGKGIGQDIIQRLAVCQPLFQGRGLRLQLGIGHRLILCFQCQHLFGNGIDLFQLPVREAAKKFFNKGHRSHLINLKNRAVMRPGSRITIQVYDTPKRQTRQTCKAILAHFYMNFL